MTFVNFRLCTNPHAVEVEVGEKIFDLHNTADFQAFRFDAPHRLVELEWQCDGTGTSLSRGANRFVIQVRKVVFLAVTPWDRELPIKEGVCLHGISRVVPGSGEYRFRSSWGEGDDFNLLFEFASGQTIEVNGETAAAVVESLDPTGHNVHVNRP